MFYFLGGVIRLTDELVKDILNSEIQHDLKHNHQYAHDHNQALYAIRFGKK